MIYDELIKNLRKVESGEYCAVASTEDFPVIQFVKDAADAIEELVDAFETALKDVAKERENHYWIPVTERLPEEYTWVLVSAKKHEVAFDAFYDGAQWKDAVLNGLIVTHWMPLPEPPKDGKAQVNK